MSTLNDLLRRVPMLAIIPLIVWLFGMTAWTASWKAETDYKVSKLIETSTNIDVQMQRIVAMEQKLIYITEYIREIKETMKEKDQ